MIKQILFISMCMLFGWTANAQTTDKGVRFLDNEAWETVVKKAKERNCWVFVDCYTSWCGPCKKLASEVFTQPQVGEFLNSRFVCVKYDVEKENGLAFARQYRDHITAFPTLLMIRPENGQLMHRIVGFFPAEDILQAVQNGIDGRTWQIMAKEYEAGKRELPFVKTYLQNLATAGESERYKEVVLDYVGGFPMDSLMNKDIWELAEIYINNPYSERFQFVLHHLNEFGARGFDCYDLERKLYLNIYYRMSDIISTGFKTENKDTLQMLCNEIEKLQEMLAFPVKNFPEYRANLRLEKSYLERNPQALFSSLLELDACGLIDNLDWKTAWVDYLVENLKSKEQIRQCAELLYRDQQEEEKNNDWVVKNAYGTIAKGYAKLGDKKRAAEYERMNEETEKKNKEKMSNWGF